MDKFLSYKKKLNGYVDVSETVKVLEKVAAGQLYSLQQRTVSLADYSKNILVLLARLQILSTDKFSAAILAATKNKSLLVLVTGDKGLVGDMWNHLFRTYHEEKQQDILVIGKKGQQNWPAASKKIKHLSFKERLPDNQEINALRKLLDSYITDGVYQSVFTLHLSPQSLVEQAPVISQLLPIKIEEKELPLQSTVLYGNPIIVGSIENLKEVLLEKYLQSRLEQIILETAVSEFSARTVTMEHASKKTDEAIKNLFMVYSRDRRQIETQKQLERFASNRTAS